MIATDRRLVVSEVFGPTFQGEGPSTGRRASFVRLGACNLTCRWCDTPYTWDWLRYPREDLQKRTVQEVLEEVLEHGTSLVVVTGGEPMLQQEAVVELATRLWARSERSYDVEVETNGTIEPSDALIDLVTFNVSPKLRGSGVAVRKAIVPRALHRFADTHRATFKFVVTNEADVAEAAHIRDLLHLDPCYLMPEARDGAELDDRLRWLAPLALQEGFDLATRLHLTLWDGERGR